MQLGLQFIQVPFEHCLLLLLTCCLLLYQRL